MEEYAGLFEELYIVVLTTKNIKYQIANIKKIDNLFLYSTDSRNKLWALWDAYKIGKKILRDNKVMDPSVRWDDRVGHDWVITAQDAFELGLVGYLLKNKFGIPLQLQIHTDFLSPYFWRESLKNKVRVILAKWLLPRADGVRVVSERINRSISNIKNPARHLPATPDDLRWRASARSGVAGGQISKIETLPIFVNTEKIKNSVVKPEVDLRKKYPQFTTIILMASRLTREKNIGLAIGAMAEIVKKYPKTGLVIVGSGPEKENLKKSVGAPPPISSPSERGRIEEGVVFEDWSDDLASYYKSADLFLLTSNYEGYGRTPIEAMAGGCPVVMSDVGLAGEILKDGETGMIYSVGDKKALVNVLVDLIGDDKKRRALGERACEVVAKLMKKEEYLKRYRELLGEIINNQ